MDRVPGNDSPSVYHVPVRMPPADLFDLWHGILLVEPPVHPADPEDGRQDSC